MANNYAIKHEQLINGETVTLTGILGYSRLTRLIEGAELDSVNQRKVAMGLYAIAGPHTTATITQAQVLYSDPAHPTIAEQYVAERCYVSDKHPENGMNYLINSLGSKLPVIAIPSTDEPGKFVQDTSYRELASGQPVMLVVRAYRTDRNRTGLALSHVVVPQEPQYFEPGGAGVSELAARGIVFAEPPQVLSPLADSGQPDPTQNPAIPVGTTMVNGMALPAPMAPASPTAVSQPVAAMPQTQPGQIQSFQSFQPVQPAPQPQSFQSFQPASPAQPAQPAVPVGPFGAAVAQSQIQPSVSQPVQSQPQPQVPQQVPQQVPGITQMAERLAQLQRENAALQQSGPVPTQAVPTVPAVANAPAAPFGSNQQVFPTPAAAGESAVGTPATPGPWDAYLPGAMVYVPDETDEVPQAQTA